MPVFPRYRPVVFPGDIERRLVDSYGVRCYYDDEAFQTLLEFLELIAPTFDYMLEKSKGLTDLVDIDLVPPDFVRYLGSLVGYTWNDDKDVEVQRKLISRLSELYKLYGTLAQVTRCLKELGATFVEIEHPFEDIFRVSDSDSLLSGVHRLEDSEFYRWGTYEIISDLAQNVWAHKISEFNPAGSVLFARTMVDLAVDPSPLAPEVNFHVAIDFPYVQDLELENPEPSVENNFDIVIEVV